jgi:Spy/CpxP family protein refolding chaperone
MARLETTIRGAVALLCLLPAMTAAAEPLPYAGLEGREIKALSAEQRAGYLAGEGMGLGLPAELNRHPGPKHVLELADELDLSTEQEAQVRAAFDSMHREAVRLGERVVAAEAELDRMFAEETASPESLRAVLDRLGALQAELRWTHLEAHLEVRETLTAAQVDAYDRLRGYDAGDHSGHTGHQHRMEHAGRSGAS